MDEGHHTGDGYHDGDGGYEDHRGECEEGSDLVVLREFVDDEGSEFVDFEDRVATVLSEAVGNEVCEIEWQPCDLSKQNIVEEFVAVGCCCRKGFNNTSCSLPFNTEYMSTFRSSCAELSKQELDMIVIGEIVAFTNSDPNHSSILRMRDICHYMHQGKPICANTFMFLHGIGRTRVKNIRCNIRMQRLLPRVHGNKHRQLHNAHSFEDTEYVVCFIFSYAEQFTLLLPGRVPRYSRSDIQLLPSSKSKREIWNEYRQTAGESDKHLYGTLYFLSSVEKFDTIDSNNATDDRFVLAMSEK